MFDAVAFAGGGNRCYWQNGVWEALCERHDLKPRLVVGASAGAWQACIALLGLGPKVRPIVIEACRSGVPNLDWSRGRHPSGALFPVAPMYRALVANALDAPALSRLKTLADIWIAISRPPAYLPGVLAPLFGIAAYQIEKRLAHPVHPRAGRAIGFRPEFLRVADMATPDDLVDALMASATVPPFMPVLRIGGTRALDGGLVDNVPVAPIEEIERAGGRTLVLLSRPYDRLPDVPGRTYLAPSRKISVGQFDITNPDGISAAYALGLEDGAKFAVSR